MTREELETTLRTDHGCQSFWLPRGWTALCAELHGKLKKVDPYYRVVEVKEKHGCLRWNIMYVEGKSEAYAMREMLQLVQRHEARSLFICQYCGEAGRLSRGQGRYKTVCDAHATRTS